LTDAEARVFILPLIRELCGNITAIWDYQNKPKPANPYLSLRLSPERDIGTETRHRTDNSGLLDIVQQKEVTLMINSFGTGTTDKINMLWQNLQRPTIVDRCFAAGISFVRSEQPQDLTFLLDGRSWEERANIDLIVTYSRSIEDNPGYIDTIAIVGELGEPDPIPPEPPEEVIVEVTIEMKGVE
jgi:hypothetical protein